MSPLLQRLLCRNARRRDVCDLSSGVRVHRAVQSDVRAGLLRRRRSDDLHPLRARLVRPIAWRERVPDLFGGAFVRRPDDSELPACRIEKEAGLVRREPAARKPRPRTAHCCRRKRCERNGCRGVPAALLERDRMHARNRTRRHCRSDGGSHHGADALADARSVNFTDSSANVRSDGGTYDVANAGSNGCAECITHAGSNASSD